MKLETCTRNAYLKKISKMNPNLPSVLNEAFLRSSHTDRPAYSHLDVTEYQTLICGDDSANGDTPALTEQTSLALGSDYKILFGERNVLPLAKFSQKDVRPSASLAQIKILNLITIYNYIFSNGLDCSITVAYLS